MNAATSPITVPKWLPQAFLLGGLLTCVLQIGCDGEPDPSPPAEPIEVPRLEDPEWVRIRRGTTISGAAAVRTVVTDSSTPGPTNRLAQSATEIQFYVDLSHPLGGFVSPIDPNESAFPAVIDAAGRELLAVYGTGGVPVEWYGFAEQVRTLGQRPRITRSLFAGGQSDLTNALAKALRDLDSGITNAAVFLTDLMVTRDGFASPIHLPNFLAPWMESAGVEAGHFDIGMVGARMEYWGVQHRSCPASGELGCWYNERELRYVELEAKVDGPIYLLILARRSGSRDDRARELTRRIKDAFTDLMRKEDVQARIHSELFTELTSESREIPINIGVVQARDPTLQLYTGAANITLWCIDERSVSLSAGWQFPLERLPVVTNGADSVLVSGIWERDQLRFTVDCREVRRSDDRPITTGFEVKGQLDQGAWHKTQNEAWAPWQTIDYTPTGTVQLLDALDRLRVVPNNFVLDFRQVFTFPDSKD